MRARRNTKALAALAAVVGALAVAATVQASIPDAGGVIHGCYKTNGGNLRVVDTDQGQACSNSETALQWNQQGVPGAQGPRGPQGPQGPQGPKGDPGSTYTAGDGLELNGNEFGIKGSYQLPQGCSLGQSPFLLGFPLSHPWGCFSAVSGGQNCSADNYVTGFGTDGNLNCAAIPDDDPPGPDVFVTRIRGDQDTPEKIATTLATLSLPAGSFTLTAEGFAAGDTVDDTVNLSCDFHPGAGGFGGTTYGVPFDYFSFNDVLELGSSTDVHLVCTSGNPHTHVEGVSMTATPVGTVLTQ